MALNLHTSAMVPGSNHALMIHLETDKKGAELVVVRSIRPDNTVVPVLKMNPNSTQFLTEHLTAFMQQYRDQKHVSVEELRKLNFDL
jgi:hypothetical protein